METSPKLVIWGFQGVLIDNAHRVIPLGRNPPPPPLFDEARAAVSALAERGHWQVVVTSYDEDGCVRTLRPDDLDLVFDGIRCGVRDKRAAYREIIALFGGDDPDMSKALGIVATIDDAMALRDCGVKTIIVVPRGADTPDRFLGIRLGDSEMAVVPDLCTVLELPELQ